MNIAVIGTGYVGLVAAACFAEMGNRVIGVDIDDERISRLNRGEVPFYEPGLEPLVHRNHNSGRLTFQTDSADAAARSDVIFLAVPTPSDEDGSADLKHVLAAACQVAAGFNGYKIIVNKSTVPVGTAARVRQVVAGVTQHPFDVVSNPEFLKEGAAVDDFMKPDRIIIGTDSERAAAVISQLYAPFHRTGNRVIVMGVESAELTKYAANAMLAIKVSFMNEIARLCERVGADVNEVRVGVGSDERIGSHFLFPGVGFGGSCFPKDLRALKHTGLAAGAEQRLANAALETNEIQKRFLPDKIQRRFPEGLKGRTIAVWGLTFKANTDDLRESPALTIIDRLLELGATVCAFDPQGIPNARRLYGERIKFADSAYKAAQGADALVVATEWNEFRTPDFAELKRSLKLPLIFDGRNLFNPDAVRRMGFEHYGIGTR